MLCSCSAFSSTLDILASLSVLVTTLAWKITGFGDTSECQNQPKVSITDASNCWWMLLQSAAGVSPHLLPWKRKLLLIDQIYWISWKQWTDTASQPVQESSANTAGGDSPDHRCSRTFTAHFPVPVWHLVESYLFGQGAVNGSNRKWEGTLWTTNNFGLFLSQTKKKSMCHESNSRMN